MTIHKKFTKCDSADCLAESHYYIINMKTLFATIIIVLTNFSINNAFSQNFNYQRTWGTYFGDENIRIRADAIDHQGNIYIVGRATIDLPSEINIATPGAYQNAYGGGESDGFIAKFSSDGNLLFATYFGGEEFDRIDGVTVDKDDNIYIIGSTESDDMIASDNAFQQYMLGGSDIFIAKFAPDGNKIWSTYFGGDSTELGIKYPSDESYVYSGITCDLLDNLYIFNITQSTGLGTPNTFQPERQNSQYLISKFTSGGFRVWSTYYDTNQGEIRAIACTNNELYVAGHTFDCIFPFNNNTYNTYFATPNCHQNTPGSCRDAFLSKFSVDGQRLWSTYVGGSNVEHLASESIKCFDGKVYLAGFTVSPNNIATPGAYQTAFDQYSKFLVKFDGNGTREWGTYCGSNRENDAQGSEASTFLSIDDTGNLYLSGSTSLRDDIATSDGFSPTKNAYGDGFVVKFSPDGERKWGTYYGGNVYDSAIKTLIFENSFYIVGQSRTIPGFPTNVTTPNSFQPNYIFNGSDSYYAGNPFIAKFDPTNLSTTSSISQKVSIYPNPNNGSFTITLKNDFTKKNSIEIYDLLGHLLRNQNFDNNETINNLNLTTGIYFAKIKTDDKYLKTEKIIVR